METDDAGAAPNQALDADIIPQETLRKYIAYAKANCRPKLQNADYDKISQARAPPAGCGPPMHAAQRLHSGGLASTLPPGKPCLLHGWKARRQSGTPWTVHARCSRCIHWRSGAASMFLLPGAREHSPFAAAVGATLRH